MEKRRFAVKDIRGPTLTALLFPQSSDITSITPQKRRAYSPTCVIATRLYIAIYLSNNWTENRATNLHLLNKTHEAEANTRSHKRENGHLVNKHNRTAKKLLEWRFPSRNTAQLDGALVSLSHCLLSMRFHFCARPSFAMVTMSHRSNPNIDLPLLTI